MSAIPTESGPLIINGYNIVADRCVFVAVDRKTGAEAKREDILFVLWRWCAEQREVRS